MSDLMSPSDINSAIENNRTISQRELEFCKWFTGLNIDDMGVATELDAFASAKKAGYTQNECEKMAMRVRNDFALQTQIAVFNKTRRGETLAKLESYARRSVDIVMNLAEEADNETVKLNSAKLLMSVGGIKESDEEAEFRRKQQAANDEFKSRLDAIR